MSVADNVCIPAPNFWLLPYPPTMSSLTGYWFCVCKKWVLCFEEAESLSSHEALLLKNSLCSNLMTRRQPMKILKTRNLPGIKMLPMGMTTKKMCHLLTYLQRQCLSMCGLSPAEMGGWQSLRPKQPLQPPRWLPSLCGRPLALLSAGDTGPKQGGQCTLLTISASPVTFWGRVVAQNFFFFLMTSKWLNWIVSVILFKF